MSIFTSEGFEFIFRWIHFMAGITWIGLLYYMNFVQGGWFAETKADVKTTAQAQLLPKVLWWFRWAAMFTFISGVIIIGLKEHTVGHQIFKTSWGAAIIVGGTLATIMWANVWFVIWPNQKVVIASAESILKGGAADPAAAAAGAKATLASRHNVLFSIPMLFFMGAASHLPLALTGNNLMIMWILIFAIILGLEFNALKGKLGPLTKVVGVIHSGLGLAVVLYLIIEIFGKM